MITIKKIAYEALRLSYGEYISSDESQLSDKYAMVLARQELNTLLQGLIYQRINEDDRSAPQMFIVRYTVATSGTPKTITLPEFYQHLPFNKGLHGIATTAAPTTFFIPRHNPEVSNGLPCADLEPGQHSYWTQGFTVTFSSGMSESSVYLYLLVAAPDSIGDTDPLPIYPEMQKVVIERLVQLLKGTETPIQNKIVNPEGDFGKTKR